MGYFAQVKSLYFPDNSGNGVYYRHMMEKHQRAFPEDSPGVTVRKMRAHCPFAGE
jgi:hypothetical protein